MNIRATRARVRSPHAPAVCASILLIVWGAAACRPLPKQQGRRILHIGTSHRILHPNVFSDYYLGILALVSNPPLMRMDSEGRIRGRLARNVEASPDRTEWRFRIRDDFFWSDGRPVTAEDVRFSIELTGRYSPSEAWIRRSLVEARTQPGEWVVFRFREPKPHLDLEFCAYRILPRHIWKEFQDPRLFQSSGPLVGCGAFIIRSVDIAAGVVQFRRNPFWKGRPPFLDGFDVHLYHNTDVLALGLRRGELDTVFLYAGSFPYPLLPGLKAGGFELLDSGGGGLIYLGINLDRPPGSIPLFRQALAFAIDYSELIRLDALGRASPPRRGFVPPGFPGYTPGEPLGFDPVRAARLLERAGCRDRDGDGVREAPDGAPMRLELIARRDYGRLAELIKNQLSESGLNLLLRIVDTATWQSLKDRGAFHLSLSRTTPWGMRMHAGWGSGYFDYRRSGAGVIGTIKDPEFLSLCDRLQRTVQPGEIEKLAGRMQEYYARTLPALALYEPDIILPVPRSWTGWLINPLNGFYNMETFLNLRRAGVQ